MSSNIRAGDILSEAFQFGYRRWFTVFRYGWMAMLFAGLIAFGALYTIFDVKAISQAGEDATLRTLADFMRLPVAPAVLVGLGAIILVMLFYAGFLASVFRLVALGEDNEGVAQLRIDGPAQRVFWAQFITSVINTGIGAFSILVAMVITGHGFGSIISGFQQFAALVIHAGANPGFKPSEEQLEALAGPFGALGMSILISLPLTIFAAIRLAPFVAGSACENRLLLFGSFRLTAGHFWSLFGVYLLFFMAMFVMTVVYSLVERFLETMTKVGGALAFIAVVFTVISFAASVAYQIFVIGVQLSLQGIVYRELKDGPQA